MGQCDFYVFCVLVKCYSKDAETGSVYVFIKKISKGAYAYTHEKMGKIKMTAKIMKVE